VNSLGLGAVHVQSTGLVGGQGARTVQGAGVQPDPGGRVLAGPSVGDGPRVVQGEREQMPAKALSGEGGQQPEVGHFYLAY
jgi:hypothetical protein